MPMPPADRHVFLSYASKDREAAERLKDALTHEGFNVWWSPAVQCAGAWHTIIDDRLNTAAAVVVLWSEAACASSWVRHEASLAIATEKYAPAKLGAAPIGAPYDHLQAVDVSGAAQAATHSGLASLVSRLHVLIPPPVPLPVRAGNFLRRHSVAAIAVFFGLTTAALLLRLAGTVERQIASASTISPAVDGLRNTVGQMEDRIVGAFQPRLGFVFQFGISATDAGFLSVENAGAGVATIERIEATFDGKPVSTTSAALATLAARHGMREFRSFALSPRDTFGPGRVRTLYQIPAKGLREKDVCPQDKARKAFFEKLRIDIEYVSSTGSRQTAQFRYKNSNDQC